MQPGVDVQSPIETDLSKTLLSVVVPAYNEEEVLTEFHKRISAVLESMAIDAEIVYVNDGSIDSTLTIMQQIRRSDPRVAIVDLSRNFGKEIALTAGLDHASGDAVVVIDADLQHPPELIPELVKHWKEGYDVVYVKRISRIEENAIKKITTFAFYRLIQMVSRVNIPEDAGDYRLLSRRALDSLKQLREQHRFMKGLFTWIGYPQKAVPYQPDPRYAGATKWSYWKLWNFALEGITSFSIFPLKIATYLGLLAALAAFVYAAIIIYQTLAHGNPVAGYPSIMVAILFLGSVQLIAIGIIGEYLGRMFNETKQRPLYFLKGYEPSASRKAQS
jgi:glycosyltransferase involved in cell wall biosynthesis